jgi:hypothetical protein
MASSTTSFTDAHLGGGYESEDVDTQTINGTGTTSTSQQQQQQRRSERPPGLNDDGLGGAIGGPNARQQWRGAVPGAKFNVANKFDEFRGPGLAQSYVIYHISYVICHMSSNHLYHSNRVQ